MLHTKKDKLKASQIIKDGEKNNTVLETCRERRIGGSVPFFPSLEAFELSANKDVWAWLLIEYLGNKELILKKAHGVCSY